MLRPDIHVNGFSLIFIFAKSIAGELDNSASRFVFVPPAFYMFIYFACHNNSPKDTVQYNRYFRQWFPNRRAN